jgi:predicted aspartyl protease
MREFAAWPIRTAVCTAALVVLASGAVADESTALTPIIVHATGPRFVAPTRRDSIGRIWAPVYINGQGPFRLVLDTGATQSGVTATVASILHLALDRTPPVLLRGVTGVATVPTVRLDELAIGDLTVAGAIVPILPDAFGGADGILGTAGLADKRIFIDFRRDRITITYSHGRFPSRGFETLHFQPNLQTPIIVDARVGGVRTKAIIDTGGELTIANDALRDALRHHWYRPRSRPDSIEGATRAVQTGEMIATPVIDLGSIRIRDPYITYSNLMIFDHWHLRHRPAILIGMDALGTLDQLVIDYKRHELDLRPRME